MTTPLLLSLVMTVILKQIPFTTAMTSQQECIM